MLSEAENLRTHTTAPILTADSPVNAAVHQLQTRRQTISPPRSRSARRREHARTHARTTYLHTRTPRHNMSACVRALATSTRTLKYQAPGAGMRYAGRVYFGSFARSLSIYSRELFAFIVKPMADGTIPIPMIPMIK